jgi:D-3-phosphoglycerate dehydrogenase
MKTVLSPTKLDGVAAEILRDSGRYEVVQQATEDLPGLARRHPDAYALIVRSEKVTAEIIDALPALKVIVRAGAGFNTIDTRHARRRGVDVMNTPGANANAVAEEVIAMMLADARHIPQADASARAGQWEKNRFMGSEIAGKTVGIVGLGNVGRLVARRLAGFDARLLGYDPVISAERAAEMSVELTDLETLFAQSDYVTLHIPENDETRGMVGAALLERMKNGATIVNCARAGIVREDDLRRVKKAKNLRFLNDVYPKDAEGPKSVADIADIMLPHLGASTAEANLAAARRAAEQLADFDQKGITSFIVNREIPEGLDRAYCDLAYTVARLCRCLVGRGAALKLIETSFYGTLGEFADWLLVPVVAGIWEDFDRSMDFQAAGKFLREMGLDYVNRVTDPKKGYGNSLTVDLCAALGADTLRRMSIRGTLTEGNLMISRINEFDRLYFDPAGHTVFFLYDDRPGVIGTIGSKLAAAGVNIADMRNPLDRKANRSLAIMKVNQPVPEAVVGEIGAAIRAHAALGITL